MKDVCFYNGYHNGDVFSSKGWIQDIMRQAPDVSYGYAHLNNPKIVEDLDCEYINLDSLPRAVKDTVRLASSDTTVFINTWIGAYVDEVLKPGEQHGNWSNLHHMWSLIYRYLKEHNDMNLVMNPDPLTYVPNTDWSYYRTDLADKFTEEHSDAKGFHLVCNGSVRSNQTRIGDMGEVIKGLAEKYKDYIFICTDKGFDANLPNIFFTSDIFGLDNDINEIAYLSTHTNCLSVTGKNSGPYMYCHVRENIFNTDKQFISLSQRPSDSYPWRTKGIKCYYNHCLAEDVQTVTKVIDSIIDDWYESTGELRVVA
jgi:hypothetical protein